MKRVLALILALVFLFALTACGKNPDNQEQNPGPGANIGENKGNNPSATTKDTLSVATTVDYGTLNGLSISALGYYPVMTVMETLWVPGVFGEMEMQLAEELEQISDSEFIVHLKKGVTFSNGNPFNADDVMFSLNLYSNDTGMFATMKTRHLDLSQCEKIDDYTVRLVMPFPSVAFHSCTGQILMFDEESYNADEQALNPIGTGPYVVKEYVVNSHCVVERRDDYWGEAPAMKTITFRVLSEPSQRVNAVETGLVDFAPVQLTDKDYVDSLSGMTTFARPGGWCLVGFNTSQDKTLADPNARYAICHAIDRAAINNLIYEGKGTIMTNPWPKFVNDNLDSIQNLGVYEKGYDLDLAKQLAEESGIVGKTLVFINNGNETMIAVAEMIQEMVQKIGVNVEIRSYDAASFYSICGDKDAFDFYVGSGTHGNYQQGDNLKSVDMNKIWGIPENWAFGQGARYFEIFSDVHNLNSDIRIPVIEECTRIYIDTVNQFGMISFDDYYAYNAGLDLGDNFFHPGMNCYYVRNFSWK